MEKNNHKKYRVLAIDDSPSNLVALEAVLKDDCALATAESGDEALNLLEHDSHFDLILIDVQMPGKDGFATAAEIKKLKGCEDIPIVFITAIYREEPFVQKGYQVGAIDYLSKPFNPEILKTKVLIYASYHRKAKEKKAADQSRQLTELLHKFQNLLEETRSKVNSLVEKSAPPEKY